MEIPSLAEAVPYIQQDSLFITGVQGVLIETEQMLGSQNWANYEIKRRTEKEGRALKEVLDAISPLWHRILLASSMRALEPATMGVVRQIQKKGNKILGYARHEVEIAYTLLKHLRSADIDLLRSAPLDRAVAVAGMEKYAKFIDGVLFVGTGGDTVKPLSKFLMLLKDRPRHVVYVDTDYYTIAAFVEEMGKAGIAAQGLQLKYSDGRSSIYLPAVAEMQMKYLEKMLPDKEARYLVDQGFGVAE